MKRRSRTRRVLKWVGTVLCVLLLAAFAMSRWYWVAMATRAYGVAIRWGRLEFGYCPALSDQEFQLQWADRSMGWPPRTDWRMDFDRYPRVHFEMHNFTDIRLDLGTRRDWYVAVPLWAVLAVIGPPTAFLWWRDRRIPPGHCRNCGYDLTGNVSGRCPECGHPVEGEAKTTDTRGQ